MPQVLDQSDPNFQADLLRAIEAGAVLLLENLSEDMDDVIEQARGGWGVWGFG